MVTKLRELLSAGMPGRIGAIEGCHIEVKPLANAMDSYLDRLNYYSIVLRGVCDSEVIFYELFPRLPRISPRRACLAELHPGTGKCSPSK